MKKLSLEEMKILRLEMLDEIDNLCRKNNLKYSLTGGTLIGAVRHHGYIPWDDDMDIAMPYSDILILKKILVSDTIAIVDSFTDPSYYYPFPRIISKKTCSKIGLWKKGPGLFIDLYPIIECSSNKLELEQFLVIAQKLLEDRRKQFRIRRYTSIFFPFFVSNDYKKAVDAYVHHQLFSISRKGTNTFYQLGCPLRRFYNNYFPFNIFESLDNAIFEGHNYLITRNFDSMLRIYCGDYMTLPPEGQRCSTHEHSFYWLKE